MPPEKVADVLALMGDSIDNIPGVPGIGEKGAKALIQEYGTLEDAPGAGRRGLPQGLPRGAPRSTREQARLSKELSTIHTDLDVPLDPEALHRDPPDLEALRKLFTELEFFSLVEELGPAGPAAAGAVEFPVAEEAVTAEVLGRPRRPAGGRRGLRRRARRGPPARPGGGRAGGGDR